MNRATLTRVVGLGAVTGMRSMAGLTTLARARTGIAKPIMTGLAVAEMCADKTPVIGNRTDPLPLGGRALMGAVVGAVVAAEDHANPLLGGILGAATALIATHLAFHLRRRLAVSSVVGGLAEDALVLGVVSLIQANATAGRHHRPI